MRTHKLGRKLYESREVTYLHHTGSPEERLNLVLLGDGYTEEEIPIYHRATAAVTDHLFKTEPFQTYRQLLNVVRIDIISPERGITDPKAGKRNHTALAIRHDFLSPHGMNTFRPWLIWRAARGITWNMAVVLANSPRRGGATIPFTRYSVLSFPPDGWDRPVTSGDMTGPSFLNPSYRFHLHHRTPPFDPEYPGTWADYACDTFIHELGHLCGLGDEYATSVYEHIGPKPWTRLMGFLPKIMRPMERLRWLCLYPNVTFYPKRPPWNGWLSIPESKVSVIQGALLMPNDAYRPQKHCKMVRERDPFCVVCRETIICRAIYRFACPAKLKVVRNKGKYRYSLKIASGLKYLKIKWRVAGQTRQDLEGVHEASLIHSPKEVEVIVIDETPWISNLPKPRFVLSPYILL